MNITTKSLPELTPREYRDCYYLNYRKNGYMQQFLRENQFEYDSKAILLTEDRLLGWALLIPTRRVDRDWGPTDYSVKKSRYTYQVYVRKTERGKGYGHALIKEALKIDPRPLFVWPHDNTSGIFYQKYHDKIICNAHERGYYLRRKIA